MILLYQFIYTIIIICCVPFILLFAAAGNKRAAQRLGLRLPKEYPKNKRIWIHALSVGEVISAIPLIEAIKLEYPDKEIVFTITTAKGLLIAKKELHEKVKIIPMPIDFWWSINRIRNHINPYFFVLVETDIWPALLNNLAQKNVKCFLVNGRVSPRTFKAYKRFSFIIKPVFNKFALCMMQSEHDAKRLIETGIDQNKILTTGNIKFDRQWLPMQKQERDNWLNKLSLSVEDDIWVAGSIHKDEEKIILNVFLQLFTQFPKLRLILAPRNIEESNKILKMAQEMGLNSILKTDRDHDKNPYPVLILNTIGELSRIYGIGKIAFVGGSMVASGGHNLLEPASFGMPVLFGPYMHNFVLMSDLILKEEGGRQVNNENELYQNIKKLLENKDLCDRMGKNSKNFVDKHQGAIKQVIGHIRKHVG
ncbi:MAG: 3-deoxy-D-manno-octulosonic acid transferase [Proteobacteria bacterium]|nr:3-deoxy-D-manno-octulosonic acid transferase [Pseudomonadota bacterium]